MGRLAGVGSDSGVRVFWTLLGGLAGSVAGALAVLSFRLHLRHARRLEAAEQNIRALVNVRPLTGRLPFGFDAWSADPVLMDVILDALSKGFPERVVECGSGWSTLLIASFFRERRTGRVISLEHDEHFARMTKQRLREYGLEDFAEVIHAPLVERELDGRRWRWYGPEAEAALDAPLELLVVDGPPGIPGARSRYPAVPILAARLAEQWVILLDDGLRSDETWIAQRWGQVLGVKPELTRSGRGVWVLRGGKGLRER